MGKLTAVRLRLLGRFAVTIDGDPSLPVGISPKKGRALLAYLGMHPEHAASRDELATLLWGDRPDHQARLSLRQCILALRTTLEPVAGDVLVHERDVVGLKPGHLVVDARLFETLAKSTQPRDLEEAVVLYAGEFLCGLDIGVEAFDDWVRATRARLEATAAGVLRTWVERSDEARDGPRAIAAVERLVGLDPLREDWQRRALTIYARHRGREAALLHAKSMVARLRHELDVDPEPATTALIEEIRRGDIAPITPPVAAPQPADQGADIAELPSPPIRRYAFAGDRSRRSDRLVGPEARSATTCPGWRRFALPASSRLARVASIAIVAVFLVALSGVALHAPNSSQRAQPALAAPDAVSVAVMPFRPLADDGASRSRSDLIVDDLTNLLDRVPGLRVMSRQASRQPRGLTSARDALGVRYVVDGTLRTQGDTFRVNVELVDASNGLQVWSDQIDRRRSESIAAQDEVVRGLARAIQVEVICAESKRPSSKLDPRPRRLLAAGWAALFASSSANTFGEAQAAFRAVLQHKPDLVGAMLGLAAHHIIAVANLAVAEREPYLTEAEQLLDQVLKRSPGSSPAYFYLGILHDLRGEPRSALDSFAHSIAINPSFAPGYASMGHALTELGRGDEALEQIRYAIRLSPKDPALPYWALFAGWAELERSHDDEAFDWFFRALALSPQSPVAHGSLAAAYALRGDRAMADKHWQKLKELTPGLSDDRRVERLGSASQTAPHRLADGLRIILASRR